MSRSSWKGKYFPIMISEKNIDYSALEKNHFLFSHNYFKKIPSYICSFVWQKKRSYNISPFHVDKVFYIYNGINWKKIYVVANMVNSLFGQYRWPKKKCVYRNKKKKKKSKK